jgi:hypothetical protein
MIAMIEKLIEYSIKDDVNGVRAQLKTYPPNKSFLVAELIPLYLLTNDSAEGNKIFDLYLNCISQRKQTLSLDLLPFEWCEWREHPSSKIDDIKRFCDPDSITPYELILYILDSHYKVDTLKNCLDIHNKEIDISEFYWEAFYDYFEEYRSYENRFSKKELFEYNYKFLECLLTHETVLTDKNMQFLFKKIFDFAKCDMDGTIECFTAVTNILESSSNSVNDSMEIDELAQNDEPQEKEISSHAFCLHSMLIYFFVKFETPLLYLISEEDKTTIIDSYKPMGQEKLAKFQEKFHFDIMMSQQAKSAMSI